MENEKEDQVEKTMDDTMRETYAAIKARDVAPSEEKPEIVEQKTEEKPAEQPAEKPKGDITPKDPISGKFKPRAAKSAEAQKNTDDPAPEGEAQPKEAAQNAVTPKAATQAPSGLSPAVKAKWDTLDPVIRTEFLKRESDAARGIQQYAEKVKRLDAIDAVVQPHHKQQFTGMYGSFENGLKEILALSDFAGKSPYDFMAYFMQQRSLDPNHLLQILQRSPAPQAVQQQQQGFPPQATNPLEQRLNALEQGIKKSQDEQVGSVLNAFVNETDAQGNPMRPHFDELRDEIALFLDRGKNLQEAYDAAVWASPAHREQMLQQKHEQELAVRKTEQEKQAKQARTASTIVNVTRPNAGATASKAKSWEDTLKEKHKAMQSGAA